MDMKKLTYDEQVACNIIRFNREYDKNNKIRKHIVLSLKGFDVTLSIALDIDINSNTGNIVFGHSLRYRKIAFYPTTNQELQCINKRGMEYLVERRKSCRNVDRNRLKGYFASLEKIRKMSILELSYRARQPYNILE